MDEEAPYLLRCELSGQHLGVVQDEDTLTLCSRAGDLACWHQMDGVFRSVWRPALTLTSHQHSDSSFSLQRQDGTEVDGRFMLVQGLARLPSAHLEELRTHGITILENVMSLSMIASLKSAVAEKRAHKYAHIPAGTQDGNFWIRDALLWSHELCATVTHPVALWLLEQYMDAADIHFCHQPIISTLFPSSGDSEAEAMGSSWHCDCECALA